MERSQKTVAVDELKARFDRMISAVLVNYKGLDVPAVTALRDQLREVGVEYKVVKNTLLRRAIEAEDWAGDLEPALIGMTAVAWSYEEPGTAAKIFKVFGRKNEHVKVKAGVIDGRVLDAHAVLNQLAVMPGRDELRAQLLATMQAPAQQFVGLMTTPARSFLYLLKAREEQQGEGA